MKLLKLFIRTETKSPDPIYIGEQDSLNVAFYDAFELNFHWEYGGFRKPICIYIN